MPINRPLERELSKGFAKAGALLVVVILLVACSPKLDWRTVQSPQESYTALFPGKPDKLERRISYQDQELLQTLEAVKIDDDIYSIGSIQLPVNQIASLSTLLSQLQNNVLERAKATGGIVEQESATYQTASRQRLSTQDYFITLKSNGKAQQFMRVRWITRPMNDGGVWVYQVSVLHANANSNDAKLFLSKEEYANFFNDFSPE